jgi:hypothetical protein
MTDFTLRDEALLNLEAKIAKYGWTAYYILAEQPWLYSIGLMENSNHPELITIGLDQDSAYNAVHRIGKLLEDGTVLQRGQRSCSPVERCPDKRAKCPSWLTGGSPMG